MILKMRRPGTTFAQDLYSDGCMKSQSSEASEEAYRTGRQRHTQGPLLLASFGHRLHPQARELNSHVLGEHEEPLEQHPGVILKEEDVLIKKMGRLPATQPESRGCPVSW